MFGSYRERYSPLSPIEGEDEHEEIVVRNTQRISVRYWLLTILNVTFATIAVVMSMHNKKTPINIDRPQDSRYENPDMNPILKQVSAYSPILDQVDLTPRLKVLDGTFHDNSSIFMQDPSPEVDKAWEMYSGAIFRTPEQTIIESGKSTENSIYFSEPGSEGQYIATWDVFHQIHCLNWLRKSVNWNYYYGDNQITEVYRIHQNHCIHMLLQTLMCHADVDLISFEWMEGHDPRLEDADGKTHLAEGEREGQPNPDFNILKMCRNWDNLIEWAEKNQESDPDETRKHLHVPDGVKLLKFSDI